MHTTSLCPISETGHLEVAVFSHRAPSDFRTWSHCDSSNHLINSLTIPITTIREINVTHFSKVFMKCSCFLHNSLRHITPCLPGPTKRQMGTCFLRRILIQLSRENDARRRFFVSILYSLNVSAKLVSFKGQIFDIIISVGF